MGNLLKHAQMELESAGLFKKDSDYEGEIGKAVIQLIKVFEKQGHSGFSASLTSNLFNKLSRFEPIYPLSGKDNEWNEIGNGVYQNNRCSHVFKENGQAYDIEGKIFREPDGATYTSRDSRVNVIFPYIPKSGIVDVSKYKDE